MTQFKGVQTFFAEYEGVNRAGFGNEVVSANVMEHATTTRF